MLIEKLGRSSNANAVTARLLPPALVWPGRCQPRLRQRHRRLACSGGLASQALSITWSPAVRACKAAEGEEERAGHLLDFVIEAGARIELVRAFARHPLPARSTTGPGHAGEASGLLRDQPDAAGSTSSS